MRIRCQARWIPRERYPPCYNRPVPQRAGVAELVDAPDSKSGGARAPCRFEPDLRYFRSTLRLDVDGLEAGEGLVVEAEEIDSYFSVIVGVAAVDGQIVSVLAVEEVAQPGETAGALLLAMVHPGLHPSQRVERGVEVQPSYDTFGVVGATFYRGHALGGG